MDIGRLNRRVTFYTPVPDENTIGETVLPLQPFATLWATVKPLRGRDYTDAQKLTSEVTYTVVIRYRTDITPDMIIEHQNKLLEIRAIMNPRSDNEMLEIVCVERMPNNGYNL